MGEPRLYFSKIVLLSQDHLLVGFSGKDRRIGAGFWDRFYVGDHPRKSVSGGKHGASIGSHLELFGHVTFQKIGNVNR